MADTTRSPLANDSKPRVAGQGSMKKANVTAPRVSDSMPGGHLKPVAGGSKRLQGVTPKPIGGSGDGEGRGNSLPR